MSILFVVLIRWPISAHPSGKSLQYSDVGKQVHASRGIRKMDRRFFSWAARCLWGWKD